VGATQVRLSAFCKELVCAGHKAEVVTAMPHHPIGRIFPKYRGCFYRREFQGGVKVHRVWLYATGGSGLSRILNYISFMLTCMIALLKTAKPDFIFVDSPPIFLGIPGRIASMLWRCPFIFNVADLWPDSVRDLGILKDGLFLQAANMLEKWIYRSADYITVVTDGIRDVLLAEKQIPASKLLFLPNGVDTELFRPGTADEQLKARLGLSGKRIILYAGNHGYAAGAEQILQAAKLLSQHLEFQFIFIGDGPEKPKLRALSEDLCLRNVSFLDSVALHELPKFLSIAEIAVISLRRAGVTRGARPAKAFVMMAAALPIVLAAEGEPERLIQAAESGLIVPPDEPRKLAAALLKLMSNPALASGMGARGREFVRDYFEWSVLVRAWLSQLREKTNFDISREATYEPSVHKSPVSL